MHNFIKVKFYGKMRLKKFQNFGIFLYTNLYKISKKSIHVLKCIQKEEMVKMRRFITADQHFGHENIIKYCNRPFDSVAEMDEAMIDNWNKIVAKDDVVYMLGDFALTRRERIVEIGNRLHGNKKLILGNHDRANESVYRRAGFSFVSRYPILIDKFIILSHAPLELLNENCPFFNIHGHVHDDPAFVDMSKVSACVCVERTMYAPVDLEFLKERYHDL